MCIRDSISFAWDTTGIPAEHLRWWGEQDGVVRYLRELLAAGAVTREAALLIDGAAIAEIIIALGPLPPVSDLGLSEVIAATGRDKKRVSGTLHFVAATHLGGTSELTNVSNREMRQALKDIGLRR